MNGATEEPWLVTISTPKINKTNTTISNTTRHAVRWIFNVLHPSTELKLI